MGIGKYGSCCAEMDIWEANSMATAYTPHTCGVPGQYRCDGIDCGDNDADERYDGVCDKDGCDINPYRMGNPNFYGRGPDFVVDTTRPMKVVTQFLTDDGTDDGDLYEIRRFYIQDGNIFDSPFSTILGGDDADSITEQFCDAKKDLFGDVKHYQELGGMKGMGDSLDRGQVMIFSLWDDVEVSMLWLDSAYPLDKPPTDPGVTRGECVGGVESTPTYLRQNFPDAYVIFKNAAVGEIGSTYGNPIPTTQSPTGPITPTEAPVAPPSSNLGYCNYNGCNGVVQGGDWCNESIENCEGNCAGTWCTNNNPSTSSPTESPTKAPSPEQSVPPSPPTGGLPATTTRYWDCSGGSCGCAYLPTGDPWNPSHCYSNAMFEAPTDNVYGAKFYGTAAVSNILFEDDEGDGWLGEGCGKCYKVTGTSNTPGYSGVETTLVLKAANYCPPQNPLCSGNNAHFDIAAPGFDVTAFSFSHVCPELEPAEAEGFAACGTWMIDEQDPNVNCDCSKFNNPVLRAGCENFYSLQWDNSNVLYEQVSCPFELDRLECDEEYPFGIPEFCASNLDPTDTTSPSSGPSDFGSDTPSSPPTIASSEGPSLSPTMEPSVGTLTPSSITTIQPTICEDDPNDEFFFKMKNGEPLFKTCDWLSTRTERKRNNICEKKTDSYNGVPPANQVCKVLCGTCSTNVPSTSPTIQPSVSPTSSNPTESPTTSSSPSMSSSMLPSVTPSTSNPTMVPTTNSPTSTPTEDPTTVPTTTSPTRTPTEDPTMSPTTPSSTPCCSNDFQTCNLSDSAWCNESLSNCQQCGGIFITGAPLDCLPKWGECTNDINGCCAPASCQGNGGYRQCLE